MLEDIVQEMVSRDEDLYLEFKSFWYWKADSMKKDDAWIELLKDFSSFFNTFSHQNEEKRYIIFGFDEKTEEFNDYYRDSNGIELIELKDIDKLKIEIISKLKKRFVCYPVFNEYENLADIQNYFSFNTIKYESKDLLIVTFYNPIYFLKLKADLGKGIKSGCILVRKLKEDGSPENRILDYSEIDEQLRIIEKNRNNILPEKETTISKVVHAFKNKYMARSKVSLVGNERNHNKSKNKEMSGIYYELFLIEGEYNTPVYFIYLTRYTSKFKTYQFLVDKNIIDSKSKIIVLVEMNNKDGGITKIKDIRNQFNKKFENCETYFIEEFSLKKLYQEFFDNEIFYNGQPLTNNYIKPFTNQSESKTADTLIKEWYLNDNNPLLVIKGNGGNGKTYCAKYFIESLFKSKKDANILYINSHDIIKDIMKRDKIEDIYDFYTILVDKQAGTNKFSKELLTLSSDSGNIIIVLDGIDEVISRKGSDFNLGVLIDSIFGEYYGNLNKTKVLMTCRDFYWDSSQNNEKAEVIELKPFDESLAYKYFSKSFEKDERKIKESMRLSSNFKTDDSLYIPYILDMVKENIISMDNDISIDLNTSILQHRKNVDDFIIAKSCEREIKKLENLEIDEQVKIFSSIAVDYEGEILEKQLISILRKKHAEKNIDKFKDHPLLINKEGILSFRYDFFASHFICIYLYDFLKNKKFEQLTDSVIDLFIQNVDYDNNFTKMLKLRLGDSYVDKLSEHLFFLNNGFYKFQGIDRKKIRDLSSTMFTLLLSFHSSHDKSIRTKILKDIYFNNNKINNLSLINLHSKSKNLTFDFSNLNFNNCHFEDYESFSECTFGNSFFKNTEFRGNLSRKGIVTNISRENFDSSTCNTIGIDILLQSKDELKENLLNETRKTVERVIRYFWQGSYFGDKRESDAKNKFKNTPKILEDLIKAGVIVTAKASTSQKRNDVFYKISEEYIDLRKMFEENDTCISFELILKNLHNT